MAAEYDCIILGAGASGLMCAATAAARGRRTLVIDHAAKPGVKLSITGGGKCNLTNRSVTSADYTGENPDFCCSALSRFTPGDLLDLVRNAGIELEEREFGQMFCKRSARDLVNFLTARCRNAGCAIALGERVREVAPLKTDHGRSGRQNTVSRAPENSPELSEQPEQDCPRYMVVTSAARYRAGSVVVATGGPAWPQAGATGTGYEIARAFGHRIVPIRPALAGLVLPKGDPLADLAGVSLPVRISLQGHKAGFPVLPLLFTHTGLSGPAALQASLHWKPGLELRIDFLPDRPVPEELGAPGAGKTLVRNLFRRFLPARLCDILLPPELAGRKAAELSRAQRDVLAARLHGFALVPSETEGFARAEVTAGGVSTERVSSRSMESSLSPGLFFCGEVLDVTGRLGGYNLHWAFASGLAAGEFC